MIPTEQTCIGEDGLSKSSSIRGKFGRRCRRVISISGNGPVHPTEASTAYYYSIFKADLSVKTSKRLRAEVVLFYYDGQFESMSYYVAGICLDCTGCIYRFGSSRRDTIFPRRMLCILRVFILLSYSFQVEPTPKTDIHGVRETAVSTRQCFGHGLCTYTAISRDRISTRPQRVGSSFLPY